MDHIMVPVTQIKEFFICIIVLEVVCWQLPSVLNHAVDQFLHFLLGMLINFSPHSTILIHAAEVIHHLAEAREIQYITAGS